MGEMGRSRLLVGEGEVGRGGERWGDHACSSARGRWGERGSWGEIGGDMARREPGTGDRGRDGEMWGEMGRCGERWGEMGPGEASR